MTVREISLIWVNEDEYEHAHLPGQTCETESVADFYEGSPGVLHISLSHLPMAPRTVVREVVEELYTLAAKKLTQWADDRAIASAAKEK